MAADGEDQTADLDLVRLATQVGVAGLAAGAPMALSGPAAVGAAVGGAALAALYTSVLPARHARMDRLLELADMGSEELGDLDPGRAEVVLAALACAATTRTDAHISALARVLRQTAADDAGTFVDDHLLTIDTLQHLQAGHIRVLHAIAAPLSDGAGNQTGVDRRMMADRQPGLGPTLDRLIEDCVALGLIYDTSHGTYQMHGWQTRAFVLTDWGRACLDFLSSKDDGAA